MPKVIYHNDGDMEYKFELTQEGIKQYSIFPLGERYDCTWSFSENRDYLPVPALWKIKKFSLFGFLFESQFASDDEWEQIQILQKGFCGLTQRAPDVCSACKGTGIDPNDNDLYCEPCGGMGRSNAGNANR